MKKGCQISDRAIFQNLESIETGREPKLRQTVLFDDSLMSRLRAIKSSEHGYRDSEPAGSF